jgi:ACT domain-containing protein
MVIMLSKRAVLTVVGIDRIGIIADVSGQLTVLRLNVEDIRQTLLNEFFTMIMIVNLSETSKTLLELQTHLQEFGKQHDLQINIQNEELFRSMHRI